MRTHPWLEPYDGAISLNDWTQEYYMSPNQYLIFRINTYFDEQTAIFAVTKPDPGIVIYGGKINSYTGEAEFSSIPLSADSSLITGKTIYKATQTVTLLKFINKTNTDIYLNGLTIECFIIENKSITSDGIIEKDIVVTGTDSNVAAENIICDILKERNSFECEIDSVHSFTINLNFQSMDDYKDILKKCAEQGLYYIIPDLQGNYRVCAAGEGTSVITIDEGDVIGGSFKINNEAPDFDKLIVNWNQKQNQSIYGSGEEEKEYNADFIADQTSADNFGNNYLAYYQKQKKVLFTTPLDAKYMNLNVGDVITVNYSKYGVNQNFQIISKIIRRNTIDFECKEI